MELAEKVFDHATLWSCHAPTNEPLHVDPSILLPLDLFDFDINELFFTYQALQRTRNQLRLRHQRSKYFKQRDSYQLQPTTTSKSLSYIAPQHNHGNRTR
jgi:hypothetical protein